MLSISSVYAPFPQSIRQSAVRLPASSMGHGDCFQASPRARFGTQETQPIVFSESEKAEAQRFLIRSTQEYKQDLDWACTINRVVNNTVDTFRRNPQLSAQTILAELSTQTRAELIKPFASEKNRDDFPSFEAFLSHIDAKNYALRFGIPRSDKLAPFKTIHFDTKYRFYKPKADQLWKKHSDSKLYSKVYARYRPTKETLLLLSKLSLDIYPHQTKPDPQNPNYRLTSIEVSEISQVLAEVNTVFEHIKDLGNRLTNHPEPPVLKALIHETAKVHWLLSHAWPYERGSATIADMFTKVVFDAYGVPTPRWKVDIDPNLHALLTPEVKDFQNDYIGLFDMASEY